MLFLLLVNCQCGAGLDDTGRPDPITGAKGPLDWEFFATSSGATGHVDVVIDGTDRRSLLSTVAVQQPDHTVGLETIFDPAGEVVFNWEDQNKSPESLTYAWFADRTSVVNWPVREEDGPLEPGEYTLRFGVYDEDFNYLGNAPVSVYNWRNTDDDITTGRASVLLVFADGVSADPDVLAATDAAIARWQEVWAVAGVSVDVEMIDSTLDPRLPFYSTDADRRELAQLAGDTDNTQVVVFLGEQLGGNIDTYGESGGIPGTLAATEYSGVVMGWLAAAGADGVFSEDDILVFGETFAHEVGHYTGLFHPVESSYSAWDALFDTPRCASESECDAELGSNFMYPYSICGVESCLRQDRITEDQAAVMNHYTGTQ